MGRGARPTRGGSRATKKSLKLVERVAAARRLGLAAFATLGEAGEERLVARALACRDPRAPAFREAVWYFAIVERTSPRLLKHFLSLPERQQRRDPSVLEVHAVHATARKRLMFLASKVHGAAFWDYAIAMTRVGGPGARGLLRARLAELARDIEERPRQAGMSLADAFTTSAAALFLLEPDSVLAARALLRAHRNRSAYGEYTNAVNWMRECVTRNPHVRTPAAMLLRRALVDLLEAGSAENVAEALPALTRLDRVRATAWAKTHILDEDWLIRMMASQALREAPRTVQGRTTALTNHARSFPDDEGVLDSLGLLPARERLALLKRHLTFAEPRRRLDAAIWLLAERGSGARRLAETAARTEPDPMIEGVLRSWTGRA